MPIVGQFSMPIDIQFSIVDINVFLEAQAHPEKHADLLFRVAGYSAYFTQLHKEVQDDIIRRTLLLGDRRKWALYSAFYVISS